MAGKVGEPCFPGIAYISLHRGRSRASSANSTRGKRGTDRLVSIWSGRAERRVGLCERILSFRDLLLFPAERRRELAHDSSFGGRSTVTHHLVHSCRDQEDVPWYAVASAPTCI
jgi:hypothetical protein